MSEAKLRKYLKKPIQPVTGHKTLTPVLFSDSKGKYLQRQQCGGIDSHIKFWCKSGRTTAEGLQWLGDNLETKIGHLDNISVYVWLGTCDLTTYDRRTSYSVLQTEPEKAVTQATENLKQIVQLFKPYPGCKVTILESPPHSVYHWNKSKGYPDTNQFQNQDCKLAWCARELNKNIRDINKTLGGVAPIFSTDLSHIKTRTTKNRHQRIADDCNYNLYRDGIHPDTLLAKVWLRKLGKLIKRDCFD